MTDVAEGQRTPPPVGESSWAELIRKEDWWANWIGLGLIGVAVGLFSSSGSLQWIAVAPQKWSHMADLAGQLQRYGIRYIALFLLWAVLFGTAAIALHIKLSKYLM